MRVTTFVKRHCLCELGLEEVVARGFDAAADYLKIVQRLGCREGLKRGDTCHRMDLGVVSELDTDEVLVPGFVEGV
eukprot:641934-Rhodomonas_salina.1